MNDFIIKSMTNYGYFAVFFLILVENVFPPIPSEVILLLGGFMTTYAGLNPFLMIIVSTLGSLAGAYLLYFLGKKLGAPGIQKILNGKIGKAIRLTNDDYLRAQEWFTKRGEKTVFLCRFVPLLRSIISIPAGIAGMDLKIFTILTIIGSVIWNAVLIYVGRAVGANWIVIGEQIDKYSKYIVLAIGVLGVLGIIYFYVNKAKKSKNEKIEETK